MKIFSSASLTGGFIFSPVKSIFFWPTEIPVVDWCFNRDLPEVMPELCQRFNFHQVNLIFLLFSHLSLSIISFINTWWIHPSSFSSPLKTGMCFYISSQPTDIIERISIKIRIFDLEDIVKELLNNFSLSQNGPFLFSFLP